jgi:hypothetical protein
MIAGAEALYDPGQASTTRSSVPCSSGSPWSLTAPGSSSPVRLGTAGDLDERFEFGLDVLVKGLAAQRES